MCLSAIYNQLTGVFNFETMDLNRVKQALGPFWFTRPAMAIHLSLVGMEPGNCFMAASIAAC